MRMRPHAFVDLWRLDTKKSAFVVKKAIQKKSMRERKKETSKEGKKDRKRERRILEWCIYSISKFMSKQIYKRANLSPVCASR